VASLLLLALPGLGCTQKMVGTSYAPTEKRTDHAARSLYDAAIRVLEKRGYGLSTRDADAFVVETTFVEKSQPPVAQLSYAWRVVTADGVLTVESSCKYNDGWGYDDCPAATRPKALIDEERILVREILADAQRTPN
jgi:hypothetical protein